MVTSFKKDTNQIKKMKTNCFIHIIQASGTLNIST